MDKNVVDFILIERFYSKTLQVTDYQPETVSQRRALYIEKESSRCRQNLVGSILAYDVETQVLAEFVNKDLIDRSLLDKRKEELKALIRSYLKKVSAEDNDLNLPTVIEAESILGL